MNNKKPDIEQIRKYLNGELDARSMHQLERQAQHDPFLMDALEGYESINADQQKNLDKLSQQLTNRINEDRKKVIPLFPLAMAASVILIIGLALLFWHNNQVASPPIKATVTIKRSEAGPVDRNVRPPVGQSLKTPANTTYAGSRTKPADAIATVKLDTALKLPSAPVIAMNRNAVAAQALGLKEPAVTPTNASPARASLNNNEVQLQGRVAGVEVTTPEGLHGMVTDINGSPLIGARIKVEGTNMAAVTDLDGRFLLPPLAVNQTLSVGYIGYESQSLKSGKNDSLNIKLKPLGNALAEAVVVGYGAERKTEAFAKNMVKGVVRNENEEPLPGVTIKVKGTAIGTLTDAQGKFRLLLKTETARLDIGFIGYRNAEVTVKNKDSINIQLQTDNSSLNEVVVTRNTGKKEIYLTAHPANGWHNFHKYLREKAVSADGRKGRVKVSFTATENGTLTGFKIIKSLSAADDAKAIDLIKAGGNWVGNQDHSVQKVTVKVVFH